MEEEVRIDNKKKKMLISSLVLATLVLIVGISYAYWQLTKVQEDTNIISSGCFGVILEGNEAINLSSQYPIKTTEGMLTTPYTFTISNTCGGSANYIVNLEALSDTTFNSSSIRIALDDTSKLYSEYTESGKYYSDSKESRTLITGALEENENVTYNLRMWIDENALVTEQNKIFSSKIVVTSGEEGEGDILDPLIENIETTSTLESINITYNANGNVGPTTCKYGTTEGTYDNTVASATSTNCYLTGLTPDTTYYYQICTTTSKGTKCEENSASTKMIPKSLSELKLGDYISMTPTSTSYTLPNELSGCDGTSSIYVQNELNPSELNIWRVIKKNEDGTVEMVSDKVSSKKVKFYGKTGYINFIKGLNTIANQYTDGKNVERTRHIGYSNQTETLTDTSKLVQSTIPWESSTKHSSNWEECNKSTSSLCGLDEEKGAGDIGFFEDYRLITSVYEDMKAYSVDGKKTNEYWLSSRNYFTYDGKWYFKGRYVQDDGVLNDKTLIHSSSYVLFPQESAIRPVVTLKSDTQIVSGDGKSSETAYQLG